MSVIGISPSSAVRGSDTVALEIHGSGFTPGAEVVFHDVIIPSQLADSHLILAFIPPELLVGAGTRQVSLRVPGATYVSGGFTFTVLNPRPSVEAIEPSAVMLGVTSDFSVTGRDFVPDARIWLGDASYQATYVSSTELRTGVPGADFSRARSLPVRVVNPIPGGGSSSVGARLSVGATPTLLGATARVVTAGSGARTLTLLGTGFTPDAVVEVDGAPRETTVLGLDRVSVEIEAAETAAPGALELVVSTAGGRSLPGWLTVASGSTGVTDYVAIERPTRDVVYDPTRDLLYFSARSAAEVFALDPHTADEAWTLPLPYEVGPLAISDDGSFLYAAMVTSSGIVRIDPDAPGVELEIVLEQGHGVRRLATIPSAPEQVVAGVSSPSGLRLVLFTGTSAAEPIEGAELVLVASSSTLYTTRGPTLLRLAVNGSALEVAEITGAPTLGSSELAYGGGYIFSEWGARWDPLAGIMRAEGRVGGPVAVDVERGRVHYYDRDTGMLHTLHPFSLEEIGRVGVPFAWQSRALARWGPDGLAVAGGDPFTVIVRSPLIGG